MSDIPDYILKTYKTAFMYYIRDPKSKFVQPVYIAPPHPRDCVYCGGLGRLYVFVASEGPFSDAPVGSYTAQFTPDGESPQKYRMNLAAKWLGDGWYAGKHEAVMCPACHGSRRNPDYIEKPAVIRVSQPIEFANTPSKHVAEIPEDYTDI